MSGVENVQRPTSNAQLSTEPVRAALAKASAALMAEMNAQGHWEGELSSSALSTATAIVALATIDRDRHGNLIRGGLRWLAGNQNADGGWGDTVKSKSNISTTALGWAAFGAAKADGEYADSVSRAARWLNPGSALVPSAGFGVPPKRTSITGRAGYYHPSTDDALKSSSRRDASTSTRDECAPRNLAAAIRLQYGKDHTFSVPILMTLALAGRIGWENTMPLPFELAALPHQVFGALRLPVVSYALPALIAIGQVIHHHRPTRNPLARLIRSLTRKRTLAVLATLQPENGGFLEATPLTSFVTMSLAAMGQRDHIVAKKGAEFLRASARADGSWAIDTDLATWVSTLAIKALPKSALSPEQRMTLREWLLGQQYRVEHPYTHAAPGGWAWTDLPGGVPDADDTPGALLALLALGALDSEKRQAGIAGVRWLLDLQNRDGGIPTFCRGWGALPFDRSSPDLTAHTLRAWSAWLPQLDARMKARTLRAMERALRFLGKVQRADGSWLPLWFGNEQAPDDENPVYGTSHVVIALRELRERGFGFHEPMLANAVSWLAAWQDADGGWSGAKDGPPTTEETALAVEALAGTAEIGAVDRGAQWLVRRVESGAWRKAAPIGFYFAKLWYYERLYPMIWTVGALGKVAAL